MKTFKSFIYADIVISVLLAVSILVRALVILGKPLGAFTLPLVLLFFLNTAVCIVSVIGIDKGYGKAVSRAWLFLLSLIIFYIVIDVVSGHYIIPPKDMEDMYVGDVYVHHRHDPYKSFRMLNPYDYDVRTAMNNLGFRGKDVPREKDPSEFRIVMLGDSFTLGQGVKDDETFWYLLEKRLNESVGQKFRVISTGVSSYSPILEYMTLKRNIDALKPDLVIMNFDMSDLLNEYVYRKIAVFGKGGEPEEVSGVEEYRKAKTSVSRKVRDWVYAHLFVTTALIELFRKYLGTEPTLQNLDVENSVTRERASMLEHTLKMPNYENFNGIMTGIEDSILRTRAFCERHGCKFILTTYPYGHQVSPREWVPGRYRYIENHNFQISDRTVDELARFSAENHIPFINAFPDFRQYKGEKLLYFSHDPHWAPTGQKLMADTIYDFLKPYLEKEYGIKLR